jgi:hypothetical protein
VRENRLRSRRFGSLQNEQRPSYEKRQAGVLKFAIQKSVLTSS